MKRALEENTITNKQRRRRVRRAFSTRNLRLEELERRVVLSNAVPATTLTLPPQVLIGSPINFTVGFSNASPTQAGYGPYIDLELPAPGAGGNNGATFASASYLGTSVSSTVLTFDASGHATHPYAKDSSGRPVVVSGTPGDQLAVLLLPFGSVTPGQPQAVVNVTANLSNKAALGTALTVKAGGASATATTPLTTRRSIRASSAPSRPLRLRPRWSR